MRRKNAVSILAVIAFLAVAATAVSANPSGENVSLTLNWDGKTVQRSVDGDYATEHPEQVGLHGVVAETRERVGELETKVDNLPADTTTTNPPAETPAATQTVGGQTVNVYPPQPKYVDEGSYASPQGGSTPPSPPSGGPSQSDPPAKPAQGATPMGAYIGVGLLVVGVVILFMWLGPVLTENARMKKEGNDLTLAKKQTEEDQRLLDVQTAAIGTIMSGSPDFPEEDARMTFRTTRGVIGSKSGRRTGSMFLAMADLAAGVRPAGSPGSGATPTGREYTAANASLLRPNSSAVPAGAPAVAAARAIGATDANVDALALRLVGRPTLTDPIVDGIRDSMVVAGDLTP